MDTYQRLGIRHIINAVGPATRLGGLPLSDAVLASMRDAIKTSVRMDELQEAAGQAIADRLGVPAAYVTSGASAALTLATAVCAVGGQPQGVDQLPRSRSAAQRVIIQHAHCDPYDHAVTAVGVDLTVIGYPTSTRDDELVRELDESVAAVLWRPGRPGDLIGLRRVAELSHTAGVPVIVDAAIEVPPVSRLHHMFDAGADLVALSGGKGLRGPHTSGLLCGTTDLIGSVALHHQDMDIRENTWQPSEVSGRQLRRGRHGIGRGMKVGREQIAGLLTAVIEYTEDPQAWEQHYEAELSSLESVLTQDTRIAITRTRNRHLDVPETTVDLAGTGIAADEVVRQLDRGDPRVHIGEDGAWCDVLTVNPMALRAGDGVQVGERIRTILSGARLGFPAPTDGANRT